MATLTPQQKIAAIKNLEQEYLAKIEVISKQYRTKVGEIMKNIEKRKIEKIRKELHSTL